MGASRSSQLPRRLGQGLEQARDLLLLDAGEGDADVGLAVGDHSDAVLVEQVGPVLLRIQLRVHLQAIGTPIVGDFKYGAADAKGRGELEDKLHLHARSLDIAHPEGGRLTISAPLPRHMLHSWKLFGFDPASEVNAFAALESKGRKR